MGHHCYYCHRRGRVTPVISVSSSNPLDSTTKYQFRTQWNRLPYMKPMRWDTMLSWTSRRPIFWWSLSYPGHLWFTALFSGVLMSVPLRTMRSDLSYVLHQRILHNRIVITRFYSKNPPWAVFHQIRFYIIICGARADYFLQHFPRIWIYWSKFNALNLLDCLNKRAQHVSLIFFLFLISVIIVLSFV